MLVAFVAVSKTSFSFDKLFSYFVPKNLQVKIKTGCFVLVPFGKSNTLRTGFVFGLKEEEKATNLKDVFEVVLDNSFLTDELLEVAKFLHKSYFCGWFETIKAVLPTGFFYDLKDCYFLKEQDFKLLTKKEKELFLELKKLENKNELNLKVKKALLNKETKKELKALLKKNFLVKIKQIKRKILNKNVAMVRQNKNCFLKENFNLTKKQKVFLEYVKKFEEIPLKKACYFCGVGDVVAKNLAKKNLITIFEKHIFKMPYEHIKKTQNIEDFVLTKEQLTAKEGILSLIKKNKFSVALLKGVTGSGKTSVFLKLIDYVLKKGKDVIFLVPEISLTTQLLFKLKSYFGEDVAVFHSAISKSEQMDEYLRVLKKKAKLVVGTRSAVFAPCKNLGLIIVDEEQGSSYKSSDLSPRYDAKEVAKFRCFKKNCILLLSSATPSIKTNYLAQKGLYNKFVLKKRYSKFGIPKVFVVDMNKAKMSQIEGISSYFLKELLINLKNKEQSIIFLNRRGFYLNVFCLNCGCGISCENCSSFLVFHKANQSFMCHHCGLTKKEIKICPNCKSSRLIFCGQGIQKIEDAIKKNIKNARVLRLDADTTFTRFDLEKKIKQFENKEYDILVGTQIVAKGLNFLNVTLVGVFSIDGILFGADFKSSERAFSLLTQVIGRSGRAQKKGRAIIQTFNPSNKIISWAAKQDYDLFYENEILERKEFLNPPFCDLCVVNFAGKDEKKLLVCAKEFILECKKRADVNVPFKLLGISTPFVEMINKNYRKRIIIKCKNSLKFREFIKSVALKVFSSKNFLKVRSNIDINSDVL